MSLPAAPLPARQKRRTMMRATLGAEGKRLDSGSVRRLIDVEFKCPQCGLRVVQLGALTTTEIACGVPCTRCNRSTGASAADI